MAVSMSRTWRARLYTLRDRGQRAATVAVVAAALLGAAAGAKVFLAPDRPDFAALAQRVGNQQAQVGAFSADFVVTWLTATAADRGVLARFITLPAGSVSVPTTPAAVVSTPQVVSVIHTGTVADADLYSVTVSLTERPYASAQPSRAFYRVPVSMWRYQPRALALPARINGPGPGADLAVSYRHGLSTDSPLYGVVSGFLATYLTSTPGLDRYAVAGSGLAPVGGYHSVVVTTLTAEKAVPDPAPAGTQIRVLAAVAAQTTQFAPVTLSYPLTLENSGGTWMVAAIDLMPRVHDTEPHPIGPGS